MNAEITDRTINDLLADICKTANLAEHFDLATYLGVIANARKKGVEAKLVTMVIGYALENELMDRL
jgi:hypothetical protein